MLYLPKDVFFARICHLYPEDHMRSQKRLVEFSIDKFAGGNRLLMAKSARSVDHSARTALFHPFAIASGPSDHLTAFHIENHDFAIAEVLINLCVPDHDGGRRK
jgi:hypothetical protein